MNDGPPAKLADIAKMVGALRADGMSVKASLIPDAEVIHDIDDVQH